MAAAAAGVFISEVSHLSAVVKANSGSALRSAHLARFDVGNSFACKESCTGPICSVANVIAGFADAILPTAASEETLALDAAGVVRGVAVPLVINQSVSQRPVAFSFGGAGLGSNVSAVDLGLGGPLLSPLQAGVWVSVPDAVSTVAAAEKSATPAIFSGTLVVTPTIAQPASSTSLGCTAQTARQGQLSTSSTLALRLDVVSNSVPAPIPQLNVTVTWRSGFGAVFVLASLNYSDLNAVSYIADRDAQSLSCVVSSLPSSGTLFQVGEAYDPAWGDATQATVPVSSLSDAIVTPGTRVNNPWCTVAYVLTVPCVSTLCYDAFAYVMSDDLSASAPASVSLTIASPMSAAVQSFCDGGNTIVSDTSGLSACASGRCKNERAVCAEASIPLGFSLCQYPERVNGSYFDKVFRVASFPTQGALWQVIPAVLVKTGLVGVPLQTLAVPRTKPLTGIAIRDMLTADATWSTAGNKTTTLYLRRLSNASSAGPFVTQWVSAVLSISSQWGPNLGDAGCLIGAPFAISPTKPRTGWRAGTGTTTNVVVVQFAEAVFPSGVFIYEVSYPGNVRQHGEG